MHNLLKIGICVTLLGMTIDGPSQSSVPAAVGLLDTLSTVGVEKVLSSRREAIRTQPLRTVYYQSDAIFLSRAAVVERRGNRVLADEGQTPSGLQRRKVMWFSDVHQRVYDQRNTTCTLIQLNDGFFYEEQCNDPVLTTWGEAKPTSLRRTVVSYDGVRTNLYYANLDYSTEKESRFGGVLEGKPPITLPTYRPSDTYDVDLSKPSGTIDVVDLADRVIVRSGGESTVTLSKTYSYMPERTVQGRSPRLERVFANPIEVAGVYLPRDVTYTFRGWTGRVSQITTRTVEYKIISKSEAEKAVNFTLPPGTRLEPHPTIDLLAGEKIANRVYRN